MTAADQDRFCCSTKTDIISSLQLNKKIKCRSYISQFTLNDEVLVSVERREQYNVTANTVIIEVDVCVGVYDRGGMKSIGEVPRLRDMDAEDSWLSRITNYDSFVDKDISVGVRDDVMESNKLYLVKHKRERKAEDSVCHPTKSTLRTTSSQFNPPGDNQLKKLPLVVNNNTTPIEECYITFKEPSNTGRTVYPQKKEILRNELYVHRGELEESHVDIMFTSYIDIDLDYCKPNVVKEDLQFTAKSPENTDTPLESPTQNTPDKHTSYCDINLKSDPHYQNDPFIKDRFKNNDSIDGIKPMAKKDEYIKKKICDEKDNEKDKSLRVKKNALISSKSNKEDDIPFAEESEDEKLNKNKGGKTVSNYLQYYLPKDKSKEEDSVESELDESTGVESSSESEYDYLDQHLLPEKSKIIIASFDDFNDMSHDEISNHSKEERVSGDMDDTNFSCENIPESSKHSVEVDFKENYFREMDPQRGLLLSYDEPINLMDIKCQEDMVLQTKDRNSPYVLNFDLGECRKEKVNIPESKIIEAKSKIEPDYISEQYQYLPVSLRQLQFQEPDQVPVEPAKSSNTKPLKVKLITSDNYTEMVEIERLIKEENEFSENKENEIDKESSASYSSGSMIVKDIMDIFITHNNIEMLIQDQNESSKVNVLAHVQEEIEDEYSYSSPNRIASREQSENYEDEFEVSQTEEESDATNASSFTRSTNLDNITLKFLDKTPIEKTSEKFTKFLEERERKLSLVPKSSPPVSRDNSVCSNLNLDKHVQEKFEKENLEKFPKVIRMSVDLKDKNSPLTSVSSTSSLEENSLEIPPQEKYADNTTLLGNKKKEYYAESKENASSSLSSYSTSFRNKEEEIKYTILPSQKVNDDDPEKCLQYIECDESSISSQWSSSADRSNLETNDPLNYESKLSESISAKGIKNIEFESSSKKFDQFLKDREKIKAEENIGTEDSSSSSASSDYKVSQNQILLRHGESIEDIEELLNHQRTSFISQGFYPLQKQQSLPNMNKRQESFSVKNKSVDHREKLQYQDKKKTVTLERNQNYINDPISKRSLSSSEEEIEPKENNMTKNVDIIQSKEKNPSFTNKKLNNSKSKSIDHRERFQELYKDNKVIKRGKSYEENVHNQRDSFSYSDNSSSSSSEDELKSFEDNEKCEILNKYSKNEEIKSDVENENELSSSPSSQSHTISTSSDEEIKNSKLKFNNKTNAQKIPIVYIRNKNEKGAHSHSSTTESSLSENDSSHPKRTTIDHREKFENDKKRGKLLKTKQIYNQKSSTPKSSSDSSHTISSSSEEESTKQIDISKKSPEIIKKNEIPKSNIHKSLTPQNSLDSSNTISSSSDDESKIPKVSSINNKDKFINEKKQNTIIVDQQKSSIPTDSSNSLSSSSDEDNNNNSQDISLDNREKFVFGKENGKIKKLLNNNNKKSPQNSFYKDSDFNKNISMDHREKFTKEDKKASLQKQISSKKEKDVTPKGSSESSHTLSSSSDEELLNNKGISIDRQEKFESKNQIGKIKKLITPSNTYESDSITSSDEESDHLHDQIEYIIPKNSTEKLNEINVNNDDLSIYSSSGDENNSFKNKSIDHREKFDNQILQKVNKKKIGNNDKNSKLSKNNINKNNRDSTCSSSVTSDTISSDKEIDGLKNKSIGRGEKCQKSISPTIVKPENTEQLLNHSFSSKSISSSSPDEESNQNMKSIDHREKFDHLKMNNKIKNVSKSQSLNKKDELNQNNLFEDKNKSNVISVESISSSSTISFSNSDDGEGEKDKQKRKYQTLPVKDTRKNILMKERSKSLQKPINIENANDSMFGGSIIDMVERKYNEYTETWSRQSPAERKLSKPKSQPNLHKTVDKELNGKFQKQNNKFPLKKLFKALKKGPRPIPSYMSPVNAFPYVPSDGEFESNDSLVNDYSAEYNVDEIKTRYGSLPDFIKELSSTKLFKAPFHKPLTAQKLLKPKKVSPKIIELDYGAGDDFIDNSKDVIRRTSSVSVTTDSSYLEKPILAEKSLKSNLAKLDSMSSSLSSSTVQSLKKSTENIMVKTPVQNSSSSSAYSLTTDSEFEPIQQPLKRNPKPSINQRFQEKSKIINESNIYPVKSNNVNRQKIPSSSESSEYSSSTDEKHQV